MYLNHYFVALIQWLAFTKLSIITNCHFGIKGHDQTVREVLLLNDPKWTALESSVPEHLNTFPLGWPKTRSGWPCDSCSSPWLGVLPNCISVERFMKCRQFLCRCFRSLDQPQGGLRGFARCACPKGRTKLAIWLGPKTVCHLPYQNLSRNDGRKTEPILPKKGGQMVYIQFSLSRSLLFTLTDSGSLR